MRRFCGSVLVLTALVVLVTLTGCKDVKPPEPETKEVKVPVDRTALKKAAREAIKRGIKYLDNTQNREQGTWDAHPGVTGIVTLAFLKNIEGYNETDPVVQKAVEYLVALQKSDGAIYQDELANYCTAIAVQVLAETKNPARAEALKAARDYLIRSQLDEGEGYNQAKNPGYGGSGYGGTVRPDMSNTQITADALKAAEDAGLERDSEAWKRMQVFMTRCQNLSETNDQKFASNDGGAVYMPWPRRGSKAGTVELPDGRQGLRSYGSMTYAFLKSMIYANVSKDDRRVQAAYDWIRKHYTLEENPGMRQQGLYYYYHTMAKALRAMGVDEVVDADGRRHDWRRDIVGALLRLQHKDGSWSNPNDRWREGSPNLVTAFAILTLEEAIAEVP